MNKLKLEFNLKDNLDKIKKSDSYFRTFINKDSLATGILILNPGEEDTQEPHESDEVYFIISGNGFLKIKNKDYEIDKTLLNTKINDYLFPSYFKMIKEMKVWILFFTAKRFFSIDVFCQSLRQKLILYFKNYKISFYK